MKEEKETHSQRLTSWNPDSDAFTKVYITNHIVEMTTLEKKPKNLRRFKRLDKYHYVDLETGEVREYRQIPESGERNKNSSFDYLRKLINLNFVGLPCELYVTLTYGKPMMDKKQLANNFRCFWNRFKYHYPDCEYIAISEPHATGAWHMHVLIKHSKAKRFYVSRQDIQNYWQHGNVWVNRIRGNDNIGAYFTAFKKSLKFSENCENNGKSKKKNGRLQFYPAFGKLFTSSRGIKRPKILRMSYRKAMELVHNASPCFSKKIPIASADGTDKREVNAIYYQQFNFKRK